jgi:hypothetical protein
MPMCAAVGRSPPEPELAINAPSAASLVLVVTLGLGSSSFAGLPIRLRTACRTLARSFTCMHLGQAVCGCRPIMRNDLPC